MIDLMGYSVLVDNEEQAEKLQEIAISQGFRWRDGSKKAKYLNERSFQFGSDGDRVITCIRGKTYYQDKHITKKAHFNDLFNSLDQCNMKLTKEQVYVNLQGKRKEELTDLYWLLKNNNQDLFHNDLPTFIEEYYKTNRFLEFYCGKWGGGSNLKTEVTIKQLKEILQPIDTLEQQLEKAKAEVERLEKKIENNKIKFGDWVAYNDHVFKAIQDEYDLHYLNNSNDFKKITNPQLIELLNNCIKTNNI